MSTAKDDGNEAKSESLEKLEDNKLEAAFAAWKSKTYALTVPLRLAALRGSVPPSWVKVLGAFFFFFFFCISSYDIRFGIQFGR